MHLVVAMAFGVISRPFARLRGAPMLTVSKKQAVAPKDAVFRILEIEVRACHQIGAPIHKA